MTSVVAVDHLQSRRSATIAAAAALLDTALVILDAAEDTAETLASRPTAQPRPFDGV